MLKLTIILVVLIMLYWSIVCGAGLKCARARDIPAALPADHVKTLRRLWMNRHRRPDRGRAARTPRGHGSSLRSILHATPDRNLRLLGGNDLDLDLAAERNARNLDRCSGGERLLEILGVDRVHRLEILDVNKENG